MGILDEYLTGSTSTPSASVPTQKPNKSVIDIYLETEPSKAVTVAPKPPISGATKEQSDILNERPSAEPTGRRGVLESVVVPAGKAGLRALTESYNQAGEGFSDILQGKSATGVGKVGLSPFTALSAVPEMAGEVTAQVTGNKQAGQIMSLATPVGGGASAVVNRLPKNKALRIMVDTIGPENAGTVAARLEANPRLSPVDVSPTALSQAQKLFTMEGDVAKSHLYNSSTSKLATAKETVSGALDNIAGSKVNVADKIDALKEKIREVGSKEINPAIAGAKPVDLSNVIKNIDATLKPGVNSIIDKDTQLALPAVEEILTRAKTFLTDGQNTRIDAEQLNRIQSALRSQGESLLQSADGASRSQGKALLKVRNDIVEAIDKATDGKYKPALAKYRDENHVSDAFEYGHDSILKNSKKLSDDPSFFDRWVKGATDAELEAAKEGARVAFDAQLNGFKSAATNPARKGTDIGEVEFNRQRIEALFGKEEATKMFNTLRDERAIANTHQKIIEGSQTAMRSAGDSRIALSKDEPKNGLMKYVGPAVMAASEAASTYAGASGLGAILSGGALVAGKGTSVVKNAIRDKLELERNARVAKYAMPEGADRQELIDALKAVAAQQLQPKKTLLSRGSGLASKVIPP